MLRCATDCAGIDSPIQALNKLGIPFKHVWSSDINADCIKQIKANFEPEILYGDPSGPYPDGDIRNRDNSNLPDIDLYVAGFPCQPFSNAGLALGLEDHRGNVFYACLDVIKRKQPEMFVLENVRGLLTHDKGRTWCVVWGELEKLRACSGYNVDWKLLNTKDYGIPQSRPRVYIIGVKQKQVVWPEKCPMKDIKSFVDHYDTTTYVLTDKGAKYVATLPNNTFIDLGFQSCNARFNPAYAPCILTSGRTFCVPMSRPANCKELGDLQGIQTFKNVVSAAKFKQQIGNMMTIDVLEKLFRCNLKKCFQLA